MIDQQQPKESLNLNQLVRELTDISSSEGEVDNFGPVSYIIKQVFENQKENEFNDALAGYTSKKNTEIEKVCSLHYQEFVQSIDQLLKVREGTLSLRGKILDLNDQVQVTGNKLVEKKKEVMENRRTLLNVEYALETMQTCLFILDMANRVQNRIANRKYYSAIKLLEQLEEKHLKNMSEFVFVKKLIESIPVTQETVRTAVLREMRDWFLKVKEQTSKVGKYAMSLTVKKNERANENLTELDDEDEEPQEQELDRQESQPDLLLETNAFIDFTPLHQCLHIHDVLGKRSLLKVIYDDNRKLQAELHLKKTFSFKGDNLEAFHNYIESIAGFFIIEAIVMESTRDFRSRYHVQVESLWDMASTKLIQIINESLHDCENPDVFLGIKKTVVSFTQTMEVYGYTVASLIELMVSMLDTYAELMKLRCAMSLTELVETDDYTAMTVQNQKEYDQVKLCYPLIDQDQSKATASAAVPYRGRGAHMTKLALEFPLTFPFSSSFPKICLLIKNFISSFFVFAEGFSQQTNEMDELLKKSLENILVVTLNGSLLSVLNKGTLHHATQILNNLPFLEKACSLFEDMLMSRKSAQAVRVSLQAAFAFDDTRSAAERRVHELICRKIDEFLDMNEYNWTTTSAKVQKSGYLDGLFFPVITVYLIAYIHTLGSTALASLPPKVVPSLYREAFEYLARRLLTFLVGPAIKKISFQFLPQYEADVHHLEEFQKEISYLKEDEIFTELKQLLSFLQLEQYEKFLEPGTRSKKFGKLKSQTLILVLEKFKSDTSYFSKSTAEEKVKTKKIEEFVKVLRTQV